jgi:hypothetical protein
MKELRAAIIRLRLRKRKHIGGAPGVHSEWEMRRPASELQISHLASDKLYLTVTLIRAVKCRTRICPAPQESYVGGAYSAW